MKKDKQEKQFRKILLIMISIILGIILIFSLYYYSKNFEYEGLNFKKTNNAGINFYYTEFPIKNYTNDVVYVIPFAFREDPRKLDSLVYPEIKLRKTAMLAAESSIIKCEDSLLSAATLSALLTRLGIKTTGATTNKTDSEINNIPYVDCENTEENTIIIFTNSTQDKIEKQNQDCYVLSINNCNAINVTERFIIGLWKSSQN